MSGNQTEERCAPFGPTGKDIYYRRKGVVFDSTITDEKTLVDIENFDVRHDDIFLATVPRSGTHWLIEIALLIVADADPTKANRVTQDQVFEMNFRSNPKLPAVAGYKVIEKWPSSCPRVIATHLAAEFLPSQVWHTKGVKVLSMVRNPLDVFASQHTLYGNMLPELVQAWPDFIQYSMTDDVTGGTWFRHVLSYWTKQQQFKDVVLLLKYEDAHRDLRATVQAIAAFLQRPLSVEQVNRIVELTAFSGMVQTYQHLEESEPDNKFRTRIHGIKPFLDKGKVGTWKGKYTGKQLEEIKSKINATFEGTGLSIDLEI
ncbi:sulfotransferase 1B1-like [Asterias amurensis]|uniref:sulfotransferase 1B1-like n=1 Tax=Asterias amurensis TaxID=7602 RepID=UPI003AB67999